METPPVAPSSLQWEGNALDLSFVRSSAASCNHFVTRSKESGKAGMKKNLTKKIAFQS